MIAWFAIDLESGLVSILGPQRSLKWVDDFSTKLAKRLGDDVRVAGVSYDPDRHNGLITCDIIEGLQQNDAFPVRVQVGRVAYRSVETLVANAVNSFRNYVRPDE